MNENSLNVTVWEFTERHRVGGFPPHTDVCRFSSASQWLNEFCISVHHESDSFHSDVMHCFCAKCYCQIVSNCVR